MKPFPTLDRLVLVLLFLIVIPTASIKVITKPDTYPTYQVVDHDGTILFSSGDVAVFVAGKWCVSADEKSLQDINHWKLVPQNREEIEGKDPTLGAFVGEQVNWLCHLQGDDTVPVVTSYKNFNSTPAVLFDVEWPEGASNTAVVGSYESAMTNYPSLQVLLPSALSWHGSFTQSIRKMSKGTEGGPTVFYNASDPTLSTVIVGSPWNFTWKSFSAGDNQNWRGNETPYWTPGTSGRITQIPKGYRQSILLYQGKGGITGTIHGWGKLMQKAGRGFPKLSDVTLEKIGYQTDNGAMYCFCKEENCSQTLIQEMEELRDQGIPMGYLSFQGAGASSGRGQAAPWCIELWGVDGGLDSRKYPMQLKEFQEALNIPLQLYAPYFCPNSPYFDNHSNWESTPSDTSLPGCGSYAFENVKPSQSREFYDWLMEKGIEKAGMISFESDFMNQNYNCVPDFVQDVDSAQTWQQGMAGAALAKNVTIQWCYASPTDVLASLDMPAVTNFRVSFDFCYGRSWDIGESSLLVWALGVAPSKDTLWSTSNNHTAIPGCPWTADHEEAAAELHVVLALMSNGPVGLSDAIGYTNSTLLKRIIMKDGTLLKASKPITAVDSTFLDTHEPILASGSTDQDGGYVYGTSGAGLSWHFVSFLLPSDYSVKVRDLWPPPVSDPANPGQLMFVYRKFADGSGCEDGEDADNCVEFVTTGNDGSAEIFVAPGLGGDNYSPTVTTVWQPCAISGWVLLGELDKYVSLSPQRFRSAECTSNGVSVDVRGAPGEEVEVTALSPEGPLQYTVVKMRITIPPSKSVTFEFQSGATNPTRSQESAETIA